MLRTPRPAFPLTLRILITLLLLSVGLDGPTLAQGKAPAAPGKLALRVRRRVETKPGSGRYHAITDSVAWDPSKTAVVICDMWDKHWCAGATKRVGEMAPRMNEVVAKARKQGVLIIHCPSDTLDFYKDTPARQLAQSALRSIETKRPLERWCRLDPGREGNLPIDDSDGGCDCSPQCKNYKAWSREIAALKVEPGDAVTDSGEAYLSDAAAGHRKRDRHGRAHQHVRSGPAVFDPATRLSGAERRAHARHDRHDVQLPHGPVRPSLHGDRPRHRAHRKELVPDDHERRSDRRPRVSLFGR